MTNQERDELIMEKLNSGMSLSDLQKLLDSEYGRVDAMKLSISNAMQSAAATRKEELARLSADCLEESSNVVQRITAADIGEVNAKKMAMDFSTYYIKLHQKCSKAVANME